MASLASPQSSTAPFSSIIPQRLQPGDNFIVRGPSVYRDITPPDDYPPPAPDADYPARPIQPALIGPNGVAQSSSSWEITIGHIFPPTCDTLSQFTMGEIRKIGSSSSYRVDLHLAYHSLPPFRQGYLRQLLEFGSFARTWPEVDAAFFHKFRTLQGREIPICYGMYCANLGGNHVYITIVEHIPSFFSLEEWVQQLGRYGGNPYEHSIITVPSPSPSGVGLTPSMFQTKISSEFRCLRRFLSCEPRLCIELETRRLKLADSSTKTLINYIHRPSRASLTIEFVVNEVKVSYREYCSSAKNQQSPIFRQQDFKLHLPGFILMYSQGRLAEKAVGGWKGVLSLKAKYNLTWDDSLPFVV